MKITLLNIDFIVIIGNWNSLKFYAHNTFSKSKTMNFACECAYVHVIRPTYKQGIPFFIVFISCHINVGPHAALHLRSIHFVSPILQWIWLKKTVFFFCLVNFNVLLLLYFLAGLSIYWQNEKRRWRKNEKKYLYDTWECKQNCNCFELF